MIDTGWARTQIDKSIQWIKGAFRWAASPPVALRSGQAFGIEVAGGGWSPACLQDETPDLRKRPAAGVAGVLDVFYTTCKIIACLSLEWETQPWQQADDIAN